MGETGRPGGRAFRRQVLQVLGAALCTWTARNVGETDPGGVDSTQEEAGGEESGCEWEMRFLRYPSHRHGNSPGRGPAGRLHPRSLNRELRVSCKDGDEAVEQTPPSKQACSDVG